MIDRWSFAQFLLSTVASSWVALYAYWYGFGMLAVAPAAVAAVCWLWIGYAALRGALVVARAAWVDIRGVGRRVREVLSV